MDENSTLGLKIVALDTSAVGVLAQDYWSQHVPARQASGQILRFLEVGGFVPFFSFHHIEEILQHENRWVVEKRLLFIKQFPVVAWSRGKTRPHAIGGIIDLQAFELEAMQDRSASTLDVIQGVKKQWIAFSSGEEFVASHYDEWLSVVRPWALAQSTRKREVDSISHTHRRVLGPLKGTMADARKARNRPLSEVEPLLARFESMLESELSSSGDKRLQDPKEVANAFTSSLIQQRLQLGEGRNAFIEWIESMGLDPGSVPDETPIEEISERVLLHSMMNVVREKAGLSRVPCAYTTLQLPPSLVVWGELMKIMRRQQRASGSDVTDRYLACYALYTDYLQNR